MESYWTVSTGICNRNSFTCRECKKIISKGSKYIARDGRRIRLTYHPNCFSGNEDPRTQLSSSYHSKKFGKVIRRLEDAPKMKGYGKFSTSYGISYGKIIQCNNKDWGKKRKKKKGK